MTSAVRVPTTEELGEALLSAAAVGNRSKMKKLIDTGLSVCHSHSPVTQFDWSVCHTHSPVTQFDWSVCHTHNPVIQFVNVNV